MINVYKECPILENDKFMIRLIKKEDTKDLLDVYSDEKAVPFFNSDNCHGDDFHYTTMKRMEDAVNFWIFSYDNGYFVRFSIVDKEINKAIGTIEFYKRASEDSFNDYGVMRLDISSNYENEECITNMLNVFLPSAFDLFGVNTIATKATPKAVNRVQALNKLKFTLTDEKLIGDDGTAYGDYWILKK